jgi:hypothetical protein
MAAAEEAHKPMPSIDIAIRESGAMVLLANNEPTNAQISIIKTTLGLHNS